MKTKETILYKQIMTKEGYAYEPVNGEGFLSKALDEQRIGILEKIGKKRHYDLEEYDHDDKMMSVGYNQALDDIIKEI